MDELKVLLVEDSEQDAELILRELHKGGFMSVVYKRVETHDEMREALTKEHWDVVLCDHALPAFNSANALGMVRALDRDLPFIIVSGVIGEGRAVAAMKSGASDFIMKGSLKRLVPAVQREIADAKERRERKRAEAELQRKKEELQKREEELRVAKQIEALKDEFIGMVSHELKNPLTVIIGALNVAETKGISLEECRELIHEAAESAEDLSAMLDNLLELSRQQSNRLSLQTEPAQIDLLVEAVGKKFQGRSSLHHIITDIPSGLPLVIIDPIRVELVLSNLIENAIKYSPEGGEIRVTVQPGKSQLMVSISDQGIGISPEDRERLFQSFERLGVQKKYDINGVGLGLRVCQILIEAHKGRIWVDSIPGKGSTFYFTLPTCPSSP